MINKNLETKAQESYIVGNSPELRKYAIQNNIPIYDSYNRLKKQVEPKEKLYGFTRKSVLGALYRVGASFTLDSIYLTSKTGDLSSYFENFDAEKFLRVAGFVVLINFADYKWDVTNKLNKVGKTAENYLKKGLPKIGATLNKIFRRKK